MLGLIWSHALSSPPVQGPAVGAFACTNRMGNGHVGRIGRSPDIFDRIRAGGGAQVARSCRATNMAAAARDDTPSFW
jgi:hypothetical protein